MNGNERPVERRADAANRRAADWKCVEDVFALVNRHHEETRELHRRAAANAGGRAVKKAAE